MTDWELIVEQIHTAMQAVDQAHEAKEALQTDTSVENLVKFQEQMKTLEEHLRLMQQILAHEDIYSIDEANERIVHTLNSKMASFHRFPHFDLEKTG